MEKFRKLYNERQLSGFLSGLGAGFADVLSAACVQKLGDAVPPFELNAARFFTQIIMSFFMVVCTRKTLKVAPIKVHWVLVSTILCVLDNTFYFTSAEYLPLGNLTIMHVTLLYTGTLLMSKLLLDRDIHLVQCVIFVVILVGQFMLLQPFNIISTGSNTSGSYDGARTIKQDGSDNTIAGYMLVTGSSVTCVIKAFVYRFHLNEVPTSVLVFWVGVLGLVVSLLLMVYMESPVLLTSGLALLLLAGHAVFASAHTILVIYTQQELNPVIYGIVMNSEEVFGFLLQYSLPQLLLPGHRNLLEGVGAVIVMSGIFAYVVTDFKIKKVTSLENM